MLPGQSKISLRLTQRQLETIRPGLVEIVGAYQAWQQTGRYPHAWRFRIHPLSEQELAGRFDEELMQEIVLAAAELKGGSSSGRRAGLNTIQIRAGILATRVRLDKLREIAWGARKERRRARSEEVKAHVQEVLGVDRPSLDRKNEQAKRTIKALERHMKRANRALKKTIGTIAYREMMDRWRRHLKWVRLHLVYFRPLPPVGHRGRAQRLLVDGFVQQAERWLRIKGYIPPPPEQLRHLMRLAIRYIRRGRTGFTLSFLMRFPSVAQPYLADFVLDRVKLNRIDSANDLGVLNGQEDE